MALSDIDDFVFQLVSTDIDLRTHPKLRLLQFDLNLRKEEIKKSQDDVIRWFNSICESVASRSLVVEVKGFPEKVESCERIENTLLALGGRTERFSIYLCGNELNKGEPMKLEDVRRSFRRVFEAGIVVEECMLSYTEVVCLLICFLTPAV